MSTKLNKKADAKVGPSSSMFLDEAACQHTRQGGDSAPSRHQGRQGQYSAQRFE